MQPHGPWQIQSSQEVYRDPWLAVRCDQVIRPDGQPGTHSVVAIKPGVSVLACDAQFNVYLTEEFHYAIGRISLETVSGGIDEGETPADAARRELQEELGITAGELISLGSVDPFTSSLVSPTQLFLATELTFGSASPEGTERIECVKIPLEEAVERVERSEITHAPSCVAILKAARFLRG